MSGTDYTRTLNLGLYKPVYNADSEMWGTHLNDNADILDTVLSSTAGIGTFLPLTGGAVTGQTSVTVNGSDLAPNANALPFLGRLYTSGATPGFSIAIQSSMNVTGGTTPANAAANPAISLWSGAIKYMPDGGLPAGTTRLQDMWAYIGNCINATNGPSSVGGVLMSEFDITANHRDDLSCRTGAAYIFDTSWPVGSPPGPRPGYGTPPTTGGWPASFNSGLSFFSHPNCVVNVGIAMGLQYSTALWDSRGAGLVGGTIQTTVAAGGTTLHVNNVVGYMQWGGVTAPVSVSNPLPVTIGANTYSVTGATFDAPGTGGVTTSLGTITLSSGIIGTDGAAGNGVVQDARTFWLREEQKIALGSDGASYLSGDGLGRLTLTAPASVNVSNLLNVGGSVFIGNALNTLGVIDVGNTQAPGGAGLNFHSSGHAVGDASLGCSGGTGTHNGILTITAAQVVVPQITFAAFPINAVNDAGAATAGVAVGQLYRNGSILMLRMS